MQYSTLWGRSLCLATPAPAALPLRRAPTLCALLLLAGLAAGCGDDSSHTPVPDAATDGTLPDARTDADIPPDAGTPQCEAPTGDGQLEGSLRRWMPLEVRLTGPTAAEDDSGPNPFLDYRLQVSFTAPSGRVYVVPGFFHGDGAGGTTGDVWAARFNPDEEGDWSYTVQFRSGTEVAVDLDSSAGTAETPDGQSGTFCIEAPGPGATGFYARGRLEYVNAHYLQTQDGSWWIKGGADSPENFLGYVGFDNTVDQPGGAGTTGLTDGLHSYDPHVGDWQPGDPDWSGGAGRGIIGALNYLASEQVNSVYFLPCNLGGDGRETYPYIDPADLLHFDLSKLAQWELVFDHAQSLGIALHFVLNETEDGNENLHDNGNLGVQRKLYYRELVARFGHHLALFWNLGEENDYGSVQQIEFATWLRDTDPVGHPITVHTHLDQPAAQYDPLVGDPHFELTSIQLAPDNAGDYTETWRFESADAGRPWVVMLDEISPAGTGVTDTNAADIRKRTLWPALLSGAGGVEWYFGYHDLPLGGDLRCEDFRTREPMWRVTRHARRFVLDHLPFWEMRPADELLTGETGDGGEVFAKEGEVYAIYLPDASSAGTLDLSATSGNFALQWFSPRDGTFDGLTQTVTASAAVDLGSPPADPTQDWVVLLQR
jgi:Domain of unknown function (DUF5060)/Putative collagen-binding domain of a collagenase